MTVQTQIGKITASKETLNSINLILIEAIKSYEARGVEIFSENTQKILDEIYNELDKVGYYDSAK